MPNTPPLPSPNRIAPLVPLVVPLVPFLASAVPLGEITGTTPPAVGVGLPAAAVPFTTCVAFAFAFPVGATRVPLTDARGGNTPALVVVVVDGIEEVAAAGTSC